MNEWHWQLMMDRLEHKLKALMASLGRFIRD